MKFTCYGPNHQHCGHFHRSYETAHNCRRSYRLQEWKRTGKSSDRRVILGCQLGFVMSGTMELAKAELNAENVAFGRVSSREARGLA